MARDLLTLVSVGVGAKWIGKFSGLFSLLTLKKEVTWKVLFINVL